MRARKVMGLACIILLLSIFTLGCGQSEDVSNGKKENATAIDKEETKVSNSESKKEKLKTKFEDLEDGMWYGDIGYVGFTPGGDGMLGTIIFHDSHDGAVFHFTNVQDNETALEFEIDPTLASGTEHLSPFSILVQKVGKTIIELKYQDYVYTLEKTSKEEFQEIYVHEEYWGGIEIEATEDQVIYLQEELQELSDSDVKIGTLRNNFDYTNKVYMYLDYVGINDSVEHIRTAILGKLIEINKVADKYLWIDYLTVTSYLNKGVAGETEENKVFNQLTFERENNKDNQAFSMVSTREDRWILGKKEIPIDDLPGYVRAFGGWGEFSREKDKDLNRQYPLYNAENLNSFSVLEQASIEGITNNKVINKIQNNNKTLESTKIKEILGYWHYAAMNQCYEITFDEFGGMIRQSPGAIAGYSFTLVNETEDSIELALATGETWTVKRDKDQLHVAKDDGYDMVLDLSSKDEEE